MIYFSYPDLTQVTDCWVQGPLLLLHPKAVRISDSEYTAKGEERRERTVTVSHNGTREGYKLAFVIARLLFGSNIKRPALIEQSDFRKGGLTIDVSGLPAFLIQGHYGSRIVHRNVVASFVQKHGEPSLLPDWKLRESANPVLP